MWTRRSPASPGTTTAWPGTWSPRCWIDSRPSCSISCSRSASVTWSAPTSPRPSPAGTTVRGCSPTLRRRTCSSKPSTVRGAGTGCTGCSPISSARNPRLGGSGAICTGGRPSGSATKGCRWRRSPRPWLVNSGRWPPRWSESTWSRSRTTGTRAAWNGYSSRCPPSRCALSRACHRPRRGPHHPGKRHRCGRAARRSAGRDDPPPGPTRRSGPDAGQPPRLRARPAGRGLGGRQRPHIAPCPPTRRPGRVGHRRRRDPTGQPANTLGTAALWAGISPTPTNIFGQPPRPGSPLPRSPSSTRPPTWRC